MLVINKPEIVDRYDDAILQSKIEIDGVRDYLWFSTPKEFGKYLCYERGDAFLVSLLLHAMRLGEDIKICCSVSERLYYSLTKHYIKIISEIFPGLKQIKIICDVDNTVLKNDGAVGTGLSCGIDSFYTIIEHTNESCPKDYKLTHLTFFNVGASGDYGGDRARVLFNQRIGAVSPCANDLNLPLVTLDSNLSDVLQMNFQKTHTYRNMAGVLALQKLFSKYYYSSGVPLNCFQLTEKDSCYYDAYGLSMLSTNTTEFIPFGENVNRVQKTEVVSNYPLSYKYLNVCTTSSNNCSRCNKCQRTLVTLDILGKVNNYGGVFNLIDYRENRAKYFGEVLGGRKFDPLKKEIYELIRKDKISIPIGAYYYQYPSFMKKFAIAHCPLSVKKIYRQMNEKQHTPPCQ